MSNIQRASARIHGISTPTHSCTSHDFSNASLGKQGRGAYADPNTLLVMSGPKGSGWPIVLTKDKNKITVQFMTCEGSMTTPRPITQAERASLRALLKREIPEFQYTDNWTPGGNDPQSPYFWLTMESEGDRKAMSFLAALYRR